MRLYSVRNTSSGERGESGPDGRNIRLSGVALLLIAVLLVAVTAAVCFAVAGGIYSRKLAKENAYRVLFPSDTDPYKIAKYQDVIDYIGSNFALEYKSDELVENAIKGYVSGLGDRYSYYIEPGQFEQYDSFLTGSYTGIGIEVSFEGDVMTVTSVMPGTPSEEAGIAAGDVIVSINGMKAETIDRTQLGSIMGQENSVVRMTLKNPAGEECEVEVTVAAINRQSVYGFGYEDGVYYIRIEQFDSDTGSEFEKMINAASSGGMKALVLDLRNNPGGFESQADKVADIILGKGLIAYAVDRDGKRCAEIMSDEGEIGVPVCLLVNGNSASASELVAGAFRDFKKGTIVGKRTFGKAIGQLSRSYKDDGSGVVITVATYFTPSGECIHGVGIAPDVEISQKSGYENTPPADIPDGEDAQLEKALEIVRKAAG